MTTASELFTDPGLRRLALAVNGEDTGHDGVTPLIYAVGHPKKRAMTALLRLGGDDIELLRILLDGGANPNLVNDRGQPVSFTAATQQRWEHVKLLLDRGASIDARDSIGSTLTLFRAMVDDFEWAYRLRDSSDEGKWKLKVKAFLESKGVKFPVPPPERPKH